MHRIELVGAVTSVEHHPRASVLNRKTTFVKFNGNRIFTSETTNRNEILNNMGDTSMLDKVIGMELEGK